MSLVAVDGKTLSRLAKNAQPENEKDDFFVGKLIAAALKEREVYVITRADFSRLELLAGEAKAETKEPETTPKVETTKVPAKTDNKTEAANVENENRPQTLAEAIRKLSPADDSHWTGAGQPAMKAVEAIYGQNVTRAEVESAAPGYDREAAAAVAG